LPVAVGLVAQELDPCVRARVLDVLAQTADRAGDLADQLGVEREEELVLVPAEP
jgi:hypothetical protein